MSTRPSGWKAPGGRPGWPYWEARFAGECQACEHPVKVGEEIMRADAGGYVHVTCPPPAQRADKFDGTSDTEMGF